jgi:hypothetical protein
VNLPSSASRGRPPDLLLEEDSELISAYEDGAEDGL